MFNQQRSVLVIHSYIIIEINMNGDDFMEPIEVEVYTYHTIPNSNDDKSPIRYLSNKEIDDACDIIERSIKELKKMNHKV